MTAVGTHTEWGQVMATLTEDNGEETPLQVKLSWGFVIYGVAQRMPACSYETYVELDVWSTLIWFAETLRRFA